MFALLLSVLAFPFGIAGLQRFYVGRIVSGIIWLLTAGLLGIGQLFDIIMIALGQFRDAEGRRVVIFARDTPSQIAKPVNQYSAVLKNKWTDSRIGFKLGNLFLNLVGAILLVVSLVLGTIIATGVPAGVAHGMFGPHMAREIARETGILDWHVLVNNILAFVLVIVATVSAGCLLFARRHTTLSHLARVPLSAIGLVIATVSLGSTVGFGRRWQQFGYYVEENLVGQAFAELFARDFWPAFVFGSIAFAASIFILAWPARSLEAETPSISAAAAATQERVAEERDKQTV